MLQNKKGHSSESAQQHLTQVRQRVAELEKRMNFKAKPLSEEEQNNLDAKFHNAARMRRWIE